MDTTLRSEQGCTKCSLRFKNVIQDLATKVSVELTQLVVSSFVSWVRKRFTILGATYLSKLFEEPFLLNADSKLRLLNHSIHHKNKHIVIKMHCCISRSRQRCAC